MYAVTMDTPGGPDVLRWADVPEPTLRPGEVLIEVAAAGVNRADLLQRRGAYPPPAGASDILGLECAGTVVAVADGGAHSADDGAAAVPSFRPGDPVCALLSGGGYAERVAVPVGQVLPLPAGISPSDAAGLPEAVCTVWSNLVITAGLSAGHTVLIHGGSSGIGTMAIQIANAIGARPIVTASTPDKLAACTELGAHRAIDYRQEDFVAEVMEETNGHGADVVLDLVGADYLQRNVSALADGGRLVVIGLMGGARSELDLGALMDKRAGVIGTKLRSRPATGPGSKAEVVSQVRTQVWPMIESGSVRPVIGRRIGMDRAAEAHRLLGTGAVVGKIVLEVPKRLGGEQSHE